MINNIRADTKNVKPSSGDKKVFNDLEKLIDGISKNKVKKEDPIKRMEKSISDLEQLRQKESTVFQNKIIDVLYYLFNSFSLNKRSLLLKNKNPDELKLPRYVGASKERFNEILNIKTKAKNDGLKANVDGREVTLNNAECLLKGIASGKINASQFKKEYNSIVDDVKAIVQKPMVTRNQEKMIKNLSLLAEIPKSKNKKTDEQPDTADMPEWENEKSAEQEKKQRGQGLEILTPSRMLSRLSISLAHLKAGNNSEKLKNEIRQLLYSLYRSKKLTQTIYNNLINTI